MLALRTLSLAVATAITGLALAGPSAAQQAPQHESLKSVDDRSRIPFPEPADQIAFALYTVQDQVLKMTVQLRPLKEGVSSEVHLETRSPGSREEWNRIATADAGQVGWSTTFRIEGWNHSIDHAYRVVHDDGSTFEGRIRKDPIDKTEIVAAAFTGNSPGPGGGKISKRDVVDSVLAIDPDVLLFTGDQVYNHTQHTAWWIQFGDLFKDAMRDRPTVCLPDDHDVGQPNLWGQSGRKVDRDSKGGYTRPAGYVKMVERQQTAHLPDPVDPQPIDQGIGVYFTRLNIGGVDFALIEDRKFKSGCYGLVTDEFGNRPDHVTKPGFDPKDYDLEDRVLLGERQLRFLDDWSQDWDGAVMKSVVSQTTFAMASNFHSKSKAFYYLDFDANGWPQAGRNRAVRALRQAGAFHICGDQHLSTVAQYGLDEFRDAGFSFCVPSIANLYPRWWAPKTDPVNPIDDGREHTGDAFDGFGNRVTMWAHTNPEKTGREPAALHDRMPGFGVVRFDKAARTIRMECWPRMIDPTAGDQGQYQGWPKTIDALDNLGKHDRSLPELVVGGAEDVVVSVLRDSSGERLYTTRIRGTRARLPVWGQGPYRLRLFHGSQTVLVGPVSVGSDAPIRVRF